MRMSVKTNDGHRLRKMCDSCRAFIPFGQRFCDRDCQKTFEKYEADQREREAKRNK